MYQPEQVRLLVQLHAFACDVEVGLVHNAGMHCTSDDPFGSVADASVAHHPKACCFRTEPLTCVCKVARKFVYGIERGRYLLPSPDVLQDWFLMDATASWSIRSLPLLVSCILGPIIPLAMFVYTKVVDRIVRQHRHKRKSWS